MGLMGRSQGMDKTHFAKIAERPTERNHASVASELPVVTAPMSSLAEAPQVSRDAFKVPFEKRATGFNTIKAPSKACFPLDTCKEKLLEDQGAQPSGGSSMATTMVASTNGACNVDTYLEGFCGTDLSALLLSRPSTTSRPGTGRTAGLIGTVRGPRPDIGALPDLSAFLASRPGTAVLSEINALFSSRPGTGALSEINAFLPPRPGTGSRPQRSMGDRVVRPPNIAGARGAGMEHNLPRLAAGSAAAAPVAAADAAEVCCLPRPAGTSQKPFRRKHPEPLTGLIDDISPMKASPRQRKLRCIRH